MVPKNTEEETQAQQKPFRSRRTIYSCGRTSVLVQMRLRANAAATRDGFCRYADANAATRDELQLVRELASAKGQTGSTQM